MREGDAVVLNKDVVRSTRETQRNCPYEAFVGIKKPNPSLTQSGQQNKEYVGVFAIVNS